MNFGVFAPPEGGLAPPEGQGRLPPPCPFVPGDEVVLRKNNKPQGFFHYILYMLLSTVLEVYNAYALLPGKV